MSGAWEIKHNQQVLCVILHTDIVPIAWSFGLKNLQLPGQVVGLSGMPYDHARNQGCQMALNNGFDFVFHMDSDVVPPRDAVLRLMNLYYHLRSQGTQAIVSGMYCRRSPPHGIPVMMKPVGKWLVDFPQGSVVEVDVCGAGCLLIHRSILETVKPQRSGKPWFDWKVDLAGFEPQHQCLSEDFTFMMHAKKFGVKTFVDTNIRCKHIGLAQAEYNSYIPLNCEAVT